MNNDELNENEKDAVKETDGTPAPDNGAKNFTLMFIALGCLVAGLITFVLSFFINGAGVYLLVTTMILALACVSFLNGQKRRAYSTACKVMRVLSYALMIACLGVFIAGTVVANTTK